MIGIQCKHCLSEWLLEEYLPSNNLGEETISTEDGELHLMIKPDVDKSTFKVKPTETVVKDFSKLVPGDHIKYKWFLDFSHHAIVKEVTQGKITLIHWQGGNGSINAKKTAEVTEDKISLDKMKQKSDFIIRMDYKGGAVRDGFVEEDSKVLTLARANASKGDRGYNIFKNNCEHFAVYCKIGNHWSFQAERLIKRCSIFLKESIKQFGINFGIESAGALMEYTVSEFTRTAVLAAQLQIIGLGLVIVIQGFALFIDLRKIYKQRKKGDFVNGEEFVGRVWHHVFRRFDKIFFAGVVPTACVVSLGILLPGGGAIAAILVGAIVSGVLSIPWGYNGDVSVGGKLVSSFVRKIVQHEDVTIRHIRELSRGDHIVLYRWFLHPRCHMIVTEVNISRDTISVIRFAHRRGVVEENISFCAPLHKVVHKRAYSSEFIIQRAKERKNLPPHAYNIFKFNCKHFAFWIATNTVPQEA